MNENDFVEETEETTREFHIYRLLDTPGATFTLVIISSILLPLIGVFSASYGQFVAGVFGLSILFTFPINAIVSFVKRKTVSIKKNVVMILIFSYVSNLVLNYSQGLWNITVKFVLAVPTVILILFVYYLVHEITYKIFEVESWERGLMNLLFVIPTTAGVISLIFGILNFSGVLKSTAIKDYLVGVTNTTAGG